MSKTWKSSESRVGAWLGAKGLKCSGRVPLSGSNSGTTASDTPHPTIFCETKRAKKYLSVVRVWDSYNNKPKINILSLPTTSDNKIISRTSNIWCFHNKDAERIYHCLYNNDELLINKWKGNYPSALTLYEETIATWQNSKLDKHKKIAHCAICSHGRPGFWIIIDKNDIIKWWPLVLEARIIREKMINQELK